MLSADVVLDKVRKLRRVAEGSTNENEAHNALLLAQKLMAEHRLAEADVAGPEPDSNPVEHVTVLAAAKHVAWKVWLSSVIAKNFRCTVYLSRSRRLNESRIHFLGRREDLAIAIEVYAGALEAATKLAGIHVRQRQDAAAWFGVPHPAKHWLDVRAAFYTGFVNGLGQRFEEQRAANQQWGLVLVQDAVVVAEAKRTIKGKGRGFGGNSGHDRDAYQAGVNAGRAHGASGTGGGPKQLRG